MAKVLPTKMSVEQFEREYLGKNAELIRGEVHSTMPAEFEHGEVAGRLHGYLAMHLFPRQLGILLSAETGFVIHAERGDSVRAPDIAFIRQERVPATREVGFARVVPDLVVEVVSPNDTTAFIDDKVSEWLSAGVLLVWVVNPSLRTVTVYRQGQSPQQFKANELLAGEPVLPEFELRIAPLFE